ncbi:MAG: M20/M25/M40 family metallo-hydrolase [Bryobacterales bacterium]|nr:M20/M25/M40 family metallo-hydrolase [Bryobacterales bacterium]
MRVFALILTASIVAAQTVPTEWRAALNQIDAESLKGHVVFLSSDALEGRNTPSRGQDIATEYIASQFMRFHLEPGAGTGGYFQETSWQQGVPASQNVEVRVGPAQVGADRASVISQNAVDIGDTEAVIFRPSEKFEPEGKIAVFVAPEEAAEQLMGSAMSFLRQTTKAKPKAIIIADPTSIIQTSMGVPKPRRADAKPPATASAPLVFVNDAAFAKTVGGLAAPVTASIKAPALDWRPFPMRNVVGILRGTDPVLRDTFIIVSAHHDHVGTTPGENDGDRVFNGANDNASGTAGVLEIAKALSQMPVRPRRSVAFVTFTGEEIGLLGSNAFVRNGPIAVTQMAANLNLEVLGRTDAQEAAPGRATVTGFSFTTLSPVLEEAGKLTGITIGGEERYSSAFFERSDNIAFAKQGVPAVTISNGYIYPEYHGLKDEWPKLDYPQMANIVRMAAAATLLLANSETAPSWTEAPATESYRQAQKKQRTPAQ